MELKCLCKKTNLDNNQKYNSHYTGYGEGEVLRFMSIPLA